MIEARGLTKRSGQRRPVSQLTFTVRPERSRGSWDNGAGKSTTMRLILGLDRRTSGSVTVNGKAYAEHPAPLGEVGVLLAVMCLWAALLLVAAAVLLREAPRCLMAFVQNPKRSRTKGRRQLLMALTCGDAV